ncbi:uncharacterized protein [Hetaerina americana]|uniref:uncharacterized protein isoform X2 n=1 Tax=Hetaerina americana TaxID=62018 RepID=UPI003A7F4657
MGSRSAAKASRSKAVSGAGTSKSSGKSGNADGKQGQSEETEEYEDLSILRKSVGTSVNGLIHALKVLQTGTEEIRSLLSQECKVIYECRVCDNLFRSLANFLSHKRIYCKGVASSLNPSGSSPCQPNGLLPYGGHSTGEPQSDGSLEMVIVEPEPPPKRQRNESPDHWLCNESTPSSDSTFVGPLPKLETSVPPIRRRKDICGVIEKLSKRACRQNLANATAVASHFASFTGGKLCLDNAVSTSTSNALYMENISETKKAVYQTLLCASSSSMKLSFPPSDSEHSTVPCVREAGNSVDMDPVGAQDCMAGSISKLSPTSSHLPDPTSCSMSGIANYTPSFPAPRNLLIKNRVAHMQAEIAESESGVLGPDGILIPSSKTNGPMFPPEVCSGGVSNSEGEEVEDEEEDGEEVSPKGKSKSDSSKGQSAEEKEEIICSICKAKFSTRKTLSHHMKSLHVMFRTYYRCPCCKTCFANNWSVYRHLYKVHRKTTDQVRKLRVLIKKKAFRKKIIVPLPNSSSQANAQSITTDKPKKSSSVTSSPPEKASSLAAKSSSSSTSASKIVSSAPGRSGSPLPPPSEATQFPAISAQHAQVLRKLENIVKQEDNNWRLESFPERPGMGQSCPGCNRRFERRAALASHAHSCHKRILLAAQKASRARNKQQQQKMAKPVTAGASGGDGGKNGKDSLKSKEPATGKHSAQEKPKIVRIKFGKSQAGVVNFHRGGAVKKEENSSEDEVEANDSGSSSSKPQPGKPVSQRGGELQSLCSVGTTYKAMPDLGMLPERIKEEESEEMERPNSASSFGTHRDSNSPLTIPTHPGKQQRIGIQIRKDYVKGDRVSVCSSGPSPPPYPPMQVAKEEEEVGDGVVLSYTFPKPDSEMEDVSLKEPSTAADDEACLDPKEGNGAQDPIQSCLEKTKAVEKEELDDEEADKTTSIEGSTFQSEDESSSIEDQTSSPEDKESQMIEDSVEGSRVESIIGPHGEVKRVFLEVIVGGVADPNSLAVDDEEASKEDDGNTAKKEEKKDVGGGGASGPRRGPNTRGKPPPSLMIAAQQRQGGRPVRNRVKVEREDFIYDLSDMKLSPTKKEDVCAGSSLTSMKKTRRNFSQQQMVSSVSQSSNGSSIGGASAIKQMLVPGVNKVEVTGRAQSSNSLNNEGAHTLRVYSGKTIGSSLPTDKPIKVPVSTKGSYPQPLAPQKMGDCRVVIGGLRSGDMTRLSVRRVYSSSRKVLSPSNMTPVAVEPEESITYSTSKKCPSSKDCNVESGEVDEGLFAEMAKIDPLVFEKPGGKTSSVLYQSDSLDSGDSVSDFGSVPHANSPVESNELNSAT